MKFGSQLKDALYPEWRSYYIDYDGLKKKLRKAERDKPFSEKDETEFVEALDNNLEKVYAFHQEKLNDIVSRIDQWDKALEELSKDGQNTSEEEMGKVQESINAIADDVNRLARFSRLNYTGFLKIVKKHDRHTNYILRPMFMVRLNQCPFWKQDDDPLLMKLSELFSKARHGGRVMSFKTPNSKEQNNVNTQAQSTRRIVVKRFFVHVDNVLELKTYVLRHLPALVYRDKSAREDDLDPPVSSLYLDNSSLDLYNERVEQTSGSQIVRLRWYGSARKNPSITVERRTLAEENRGELTDRFTIKYKYVSGYIAGDNTFIKKTADKMRKSVGISEQDVEKFEHLATEVQQLITQKNLQPVLRTYYKRTAFQIPGDNRVRMALDTDLCFIREDSGLFSDDSTVRRPDGNWLRPDADVDYPFVNVKPDSDVNRYPYATFEIKLLLGQDEEEPEWIIDLEESGLLEQAPQFSKFVHGMAILFDTRVALLPYWLASVDDDLQQIPLVPSQSSSASKKQQQDKGKKRAATPPAEESSLLARRKPSQATERTSLLGNDANQLPSYTGMNGSSPRTQVEEEETWTDFLKEVPRKLFNRNTDSQQQREPVQLPPGVKVPKKVITPLRVEPKVFFANERTYFSWMSLGSMLVTFSIALFNSGDAVGKISGIVYTLVSLSTMVYGMGLYYRRRELICARAPGPYDDTTGPTIICFALLFAVALNAYLKFTVKNPSLFYL